MNSDRLGMPRIASRRGSSTLNVMISCFRLAIAAYGWHLLHRITSVRFVYPQPGKSANK